MSEEQPQTLDYGSGPKELSRAGAAWLRVVIVLTGLVGAYGLVMAAVGAIVWLDEGYAYGRGILAVGLILGVPMCLYCLRKIGEYRRRREAAERREENGR